MSDLSPCLDCGACCATFKVSFHWSELASAGGTVPNEWTAQVNPHRNCMQGTQKKSPRCTALQGVIGEAVSCAIYVDRPSPCRDFNHALAAGPYNEFCDKARLKHGLFPLIQEQAS